MFYQSFCFSGLQQAVDVILTKGYVSYRFINRLHNYDPFSFHLSMIHTTLKALGLNRKEIDLYLQMLAVGAQAASVLARKVGLPRSSVQFLAESLVKKGVATKHKHRSITTYQPTNPEHLVRILESEKHEYINEIEKRVEEVSAIVPKLKELQGNSYSRPQVRFFEGREGLKMIFEDSLTAKETIRTLANFEERDKCLPDYFKDYYKRRVDKGVFIRAIYPDTEFGVRRRERDEQSHRESLLIDKDKYKWLPEIQFYDDKVTIASGSDMVGVIIEGKDISQAMKVLFDLAWEGIAAKQAQEKKGKKGDTTK